jgi:dnd system-associated protein 4
MRSKRIPRSETQNEVIARLVRDKEGEDKNKEKTTLLGYHSGSPLPLKDADGEDDSASGKSIDQDTFKGCPDWPGYIYLLSLANTRSSDCLNATEEHDHDRVELFAQYANGGLDVLRREALFEYKTLEFAQKLMELSYDESDGVAEDLKL